MNPYAYVSKITAPKTTPAQKAMEASLLALLEEKDLHRVTVKEVCARANVARSTFYAYYDTVDDCLLSIENRFLHQIIALNMDLKTAERIEQVDLSFFDETIRFLQVNQDMLRLFLLKGYNSRFVDKWKDGIKFHLYQQIPDRVSGSNKELTLEIIASGTIGAYRHWLKNPQELDIGYVKQMIRNALASYAKL